MADAPCAHFNLSITVATYFGLSSPETDKIGLKAEYSEYLSEFLGKTDDASFFSKMCQICGLKNRGGNGLWSQLDWGVRVNLAHPNPLPNFGGHYTLPLLHQFGPITQNSDHYSIFTKFCT